MKNNKLKKIFYLFLSIFLINSYSIANEEFNFDVTEVEIKENGNKFYGKNGGIATTPDGLYIEGEEFDYDKPSNILIIKGKIKFVFWDPLAAETKVGVLPRPDCLYSLCYYCQLWILPSNNGKWKKTGDLPEALLALEAVCGDSHYGLDQPFVLHEANSLHWRVHHPPQRPNPYFYQIHGYLYYLCDILHVWILCFAERRCWRWKL